MNRKHYAFVALIVYPKNAPPDDHDEARKEWWNEEGPLIFGDIADVPAPGILSVRHFPAGGPQLVPCKTGNGYGISLEVALEAEEEREAWLRVMNYCWDLSHAMSGSPYHDNGYRAWCELRVHAEAETDDQRPEVEDEDEFGENLLEEHANA